MPEHATALPLAWCLGAYFVLQLLLNLRLRAIPRDAAARRERLLRTAAANGSVNSLFFIAASSWLMLSGLVPRPQLPQPLWAWLLGALPAGLLLWGLRVRLAGLGRRIFGGSAFVLPAEQLLRNPQDLAVINRSVLQLSLFEPLGHELFFRGCVLALMLKIYGLGPALLATAIVELLLRLNPAWTLSVLVSSLALSWMANAGGGPLATICTAMLAGFLQAYVTAYQSMKTTHKQPPAA